MKTYTVVFPLYLVAAGYPSSVKVRARSEDEALAKAEAKARKLSQEN